MDLGPLLGLWLQSSVIGLTMQIAGIIIFVLVYGRMIEIYLMTSLAPLPVATLSNRGAGQHRAELPKIPVRRGLSRDAHTGLCCDLCGAHPRHRHRRRSDWSDMGNRGLYGSSVLPSLRQAALPSASSGRIKRTDFGTICPEAGKGGTILSKDVILTPEQIAAEERRWLFDAPIAELAEVKGVTVDEAVKLRTDAILQRPLFPSKSRFV